MRSAPNPHGSLRHARSLALLPAALLLGSLGGCDNEVIYETATPTGSACAAGMQDHDGDGICLPSCGSALLDCDVHEGCDDSSGTAQCVCEDGYARNSEGQCVLVSVSLGTCGNPIQLDPTMSSVSGSTADGPDVLQGGCQYDTSNEQVYQLAVQDQLHLVVESASLDVGLYVRPFCEVAGSETACDAGAGTADARLELDVAGGEFLIVDGNGTAIGPYMLKLTWSCHAGAIVDPATGRCVDDPCDPDPCANGSEHRHTCVPAPPSSYECTCDPGYVDDPDQPGACIPDPNADGDTCDSPIVLAVVEQGTVSGSNTTSQGDGTGSCGGQGPDRIYMFTLDEPMRAEFAMTGYDTVLHLRTSCASPNSEVECNDDDDSINAGFDRHLQAGIYYLWADSYGQGGSYTLSYGFRTNPCDADPCPGTPECVPSGDWSGYDCVCPDGTIPYEADCVDDPCDPNVCTTGPAHRTRCEPLLASATYECVCAIGFMDDPGAPGGACIEDPSAKDWAFFVYLNGDNDLESFAYEDLAEMKQVGSSADVDIVLLFDTDSQDGGHSRYLRVTAGGTELIEQLGEVDMGDWHTLAEFGAWAVAAYPARHQALILWDHGDGWKASPSVPEPLKAFSNDFNGTMAGISISNGDYARALQAIVTARGEKLDLVGFDACLMGMWEVAEATSPYAIRLVGSEETEPGAGWPYDLVLAPLVADPSLSPTAFGAAIVDAYVGDNSYNSTMALLDLEAIPAFRTPMTAFANALLASSSLYSSINSARGATQAFYLSDHIDLADFATRVDAIGAVSADVHAAAAGLLAALPTVVLHADAQSSYPGANGLAIYLPERNSYFDSAYVGAGAVWADGATWDEFAQDFAQ